MPMTAQPGLLEIFQKFGVALLLGFVIGLEREKEKGGVFAGVRTFTLLSLLGCVSALINGLTPGWFFSVAFAVTAAFILLGYRNMAPSLPHPGTTTEAAALITFLYGGLVWWDLMVPAIALTIVTILLLASKKPLTALSDRLEPHDFMAAVQFGLISAVILPILPDRTFDPLGALNPYRIWIMVVLIAGLNLAAYAVIKAVGARRGIGIMSLLGGLLSSTALTLTFARRSRQQPEESGDFASGLCLANMLMFPRVLAILLVLHPPTARLLLMPMAVGTLAGLVCSLAIWTWNKRQSRDDKTITLEVTNPFELWPALQFGLLFAAVLLLGRAAEAAWGTPGIYVSGFLAGGASMDAVTLTLAEMTGGTITAHTAATGVVLAAAGSMLAKCVIVMASGNARLKRIVLPAFLVILAAALAGVLFI